MTQPRILRTGLGFGESPRWHDGRLWFCNWGFGEVVAVDLDGKSEVMAQIPTTVPFSIDWLPDRRLLVVSGRRVWADLGRGVPDGICTDADGAVWYADVPNKRCVRVREGGEVLQTIDLDRGGFACMLGGADGRTLFMVAAEWRGMEQAAEVMQEKTGQVLAAQAPAPGAGWPGPGAPARP